jgi:hypothetical protein
MNEGHILGCRFGRSNVGYRGELARMVGISLHGNFIIAVHLDQTDAVRRQMSWTAVQCYAQCQIIIDVTRPLCRRKFWLRNPPYTVKIVCESRTRDQRIE